MGEKQVKGVMDSLFENLKNVVGANTVIGDPINTNDGTTIIPVSKVAIGFASGGNEKERKEQPAGGDDLFGGGAGGGASVTPIGFIVTTEGNVRFLPITQNITSIDRLIDTVPGVVDKINGFVQDYQAKKSAKNEENGNLTE